MEQLSRKATGVCRHQDCRHGEQGFPRGGQLSDVQDDAWSHGLINSRSNVFSRG
ncbi:hypothetical protein [uncultured Bacteroides sp.]|uniref:hypothetical protein n=1 Tax=uncultured Bacteroides sp. TaxID=162156 RepID=UPI002616B34B|nr:hypothetical protein [uncultured Bacteroides sp.]